MYIKHYTSHVLCITKHELQSQRPNVHSSVVNQRPVLLRMCNAVWSWGKLIAMCCDQLWALRPAGRIPLWSADPSLSRLPLIPSVSHTHTQTYIYSIQCELAHPTHATHCDRVLSKWDGVCGEERTVIYILKLSLTRVLNKQRQQKQNCAATSWNMCTSLEIVGDLNNRQALLLFRSFLFIFLSHSNDFTLFYVVESK